MRCFFCLFVVFFLFLLRTFGRRGDVPVPAGFGHPRSSLVVGHCRPDDRLVQRSHFIYSISSRASGLVLRSSIKCRFHKYAVRRIASNSQADLEKTLTGSAIQLGWRFKKKPNRFVGPRKVFEVTEMKVNLNLISPEKLAKTRWSFNYLRTQL